MYIIKVINIDCKSINLGSIPNTYYIVNLMVKCQSYKLNDIGSNPLQLRYNLKVKY